MGLYTNAIAIKKLRLEVEEQGTTLAQLRGEIRAMDLEFSQLYDKVSHQMSRMAKRTALRETREAPNGEEILPAEDGPDPISAKILARRAHTGVRK